MKTQINKAKEYDPAFLGFYRELGNENKLYFDEKKPKVTAAAYMHFGEQPGDIDRSTTLYSFKSSFELLNADIADIRFLVKSAVDHKYCVFFVHLFTSKICTYPMKKSLWSKKIELFCNKMVKMRKMVEKMIVQIDREFEQNEIKKFGR